MATTRKKRIASKKLGRSSDRRHTRPAGGEKGTIEVPIRLLHEVLDVLDWSLRAGNEGPRRDSRGEMLWSEDDHWSDDLNLLFDLEGDLLQLLKDREVERAVAEALAARAHLVELRGGHAREAGR